MVDRVYGIPCRCAARATAHSPSWFINLVNPVGANAKGCADRDPRTEVVGSTSETSRSTDGLNSRSAYSCRARRRLISSDAAPST
jgi:hypothetical protein